MIFSLKRLEARRKISADFRGQTFETRKHIFGAIPRNCNNDLENGEILRYQEKSRLTGNLTMSPRKRDLLCHVTDKDSR